MTKTELAELKSLKQEIRQMEEELRALPMTRDSVKGSMTEHPYIEVTIPITGADEGRGKALYKRLDGKLIDLQQSVSDMEDWLDSIEDSEMRTILRLYYRNGLTQEEIAEELGFNEKTIRRKIKTFWRNVL